MPWNPRLGIGSRFLVAVQATERNRQRAGILPVLRRDMDGLSLRRGVEPRPNASSELLAFQNLSGQRRHTAVNRRSQSKDGLYLRYEWSLRARLGEFEDICLCNLRESIAMMRVITVNTDQFANLANLRMELKAIEKGGELDSEEGQLKQAREVLINMMQTYHRSRFELGRALWGYRALYKANRGWMPAAKTIAAFLTLSLRTLFRIIDDYESASNLPRLTLEALQQLDVDPAAAKHRELVDDLLEMPEPKTRAEAVAVTARAVEKHNTAKQERKSSLAKAQSKESAEAFANRLVAQCLKRYSALDLKVRDADARCVVDHVVSKLGEKIPSLRDSESTRRLAA